MSDAADVRKPSRRLRRCLGGAGLLLLAVVLFLNYRPRLPGEFSTRYGHPCSQAQMLDAICAVRGEDVRGQLGFVRSEGHFPDSHSCFRLPATGETFVVDETTGRLKRWELGTFQPPLGVPVTPSEAYHRAFLRRYYPWVPAEQMHLEGCHSAQRREFRYKEALAGGTSSWNLCRFGWDKTRTRLVDACMNYARPQLDPRPALTRPEAECLALRRAHRHRGLVGAAVGDQPQSFGTHAALLPDSLGVQRLIYEVGLSRLTWKRWAHPTGGCLCDETPTRDFVFVDAHSGAAFPFVIGPLWELGVVTQRLDLYLGNDNVPGLIYPSIRLWGEPYMCGKYLQSALWAGQYSFDRATGVFTVRDEGRTWVGRRGSPFLHGPEGLSMAWTPPRMIEGELSLPTQMIRRITGWSIRGHLGWLTVTPPRSRR